jgi:ADP-heptose:LPS heptosyltransferase
MPPVVFHHPSSPSNAQRTSLHGNLANWRRCVAAWLTRRLIASPKNLVQKGELPVCGIQRILICRPNHRLGNTLLLTPLMVEIERRFPGAEVDVLSAGPAAPAIFRGFDIVGECTTLDRRAARRPLATFLALRKLRSRRYDLVIDAAAGSSSGRIVSSMARARFQLRTDAMPTERLGTHLAARPVHALRWALGAPVGLNVPPLDIRLTDAERRSGDDALARVVRELDERGLPIIAIFPNATGAKRLPANWWCEFTNELLSRTGRACVVELVSAEGESRLGGGYATYYTSDPRKLAAFIDAAGTYISADCGVMHLAAATSATTIGIFGPTDPARYAPYGRNNAGIPCDDGCPRRAAEKVAAQLHS